MVTEFNKYIKTSSFNPNSTYSKTHTRQSQHSLALMYECVVGVLMMESQI